MSRHATAVTLCFMLPLIADYYAADAAAMSTPYADITPAVTRAPWMLSYAITPLMPREYAAMMDARYAAHIAVAMALRR